MTVWLTWAFYVAVAIGLGFLALLLNPSADAGTVFAGSLAGVALLIAIRAERRQ